MKFISFFNTPHTRGAVAATEEGLCRLWLPSDPQLPDLQECGSELTNKAAQLLHRYFSVSPSVDFSGLQLDLSGYTEFQRQVLLLVRAIPCGAILSYGTVAEMFGDRRKARAVGASLAANHLPIIIPCHRVVSASGKMTGFSAAGGIKTKKMLLESEGIHFNGEQISMKSASFAQMFFAKK